LPSDREYQAEANGFVRNDRPAGFGGLQDNGMQPPRAEGDVPVQKPKDKTRPFPTGDPGPKLSAKKEVQWNEDTHYYALKASTDTRFRVRHAPIPAKGTPWPLPQLYNSEETVFPVSEDFQFHAIGETCDVLEFYFERIRRVIFGDAAEDSDSDSRYWRQATNVVHFLNVTVLKECNELPSLEMDESCELRCRADCSASRHPFRWRRLHFRRCQCARCDLRLLRIASGIPPAHCLGL
jgi:hypothetical protein